MQTPKGLVSHSKELGIFFPEGYEVAGICLLCPFVVLVFALVWFGLV